MSLAWGCYFCSRCDLLECGWRNSGNFSRLSMSSFEFNVYMEVYLRKQLSSTWTCEAHQAMEALHGCGCRLVSTDAHCEMWLNLVWIRWNSLGLPRDCHRNGGPGMVSFNVDGMKSVTYWRYDVSGGAITVITWYSCMNFWMNANQQGKSKILVYFRCLNRSLQDEDVLGYP